MSAFYADGGSGPPTPAENFVNATLKAVAILVFVATPLTLVDMFALYGVIRLFSWVGVE